MNFSELTIKEYSDILASRTSVPGGGSCLALVLELACSLGLMTANFTLNKKGYEDVEEKVKELFPNAFKRGSFFPVFDLDGYEIALARKEEKIGSGHQGFNTFTNNC